MTYDEFLRRFGGAVRTKNVADPSRADEPGFPFNKRVHVVPPDPEIPSEFIRLDPWEAEYLFIAAGLARQGIVEIGRFNGGSAFVMACAAPTLPIFSVDIAPQDDARLSSMFEATGVGANVTLVLGDSQRDAFPATPSYDFLFVDGDHSYDGAMADLRHWWPGLAPGGHVVCHDAYAKQPCMAAIADFMFQQDAYTVVPAIKHHYHGHHPAGSMAHFRKRQGSAGSAP